MPFKFAGRVTAALKAHAAEVAPQGLAAYAKFNGVMIGATKFGRRTQAYLNGMPCSFMELEELLCKMYREVFGDKDSEDAPQLEMKSHPHTPVTRGQKDFVKANPDAIALKPTLTTVQEFKTAPPGTYNVAGEAAGYLSRMQIMQYMHRDVLERLHNSRTHHRRRLVRKAMDYSHAILSELFAITRRYGCAVRISGAKVTIEDKPTRPSVVKRLDKLARIYTATYGVRGTMDRIIKTK